MNRGADRLRGEERGRRCRPDAPLSACVVWGNDYASGVANLGHQRVWALADDVPGWSADRLYALPRPRVRPASFAWDRPLGSFDLVLASVSFENDYPALLETLRAAGLLAGHGERTGPLLIAGGAAPGLNPLPLAPFFDAVYSGDAEAVLPSLLEGIYENPPRTRGEAWSLFEKHGLLVDALGATGERKAWVSPSYATSETVHPAGHFGETALVELGRGCPRWCRFCAVGWTAGGYRPADAGALREQIVRVTGDLGVNRVGLVGAAIAEGDDLPDLLRWLKERGLRATASSLRADLLNGETARLLVELGQRTLTLSAEAGSQVLRDALGKGLSDADLLAAADAAREAGARGLKLYLMYGLPGETDDDLRAAGSLAVRIRKNLGRTRLTVSASPFVPKPGTPLSDAPLVEERELRRRREILADALRRAGVRSFTGESPRQALWQAALTRGDRTVLARLLAGETRGALVKEAVHRR
jgi:radical SAM superfamily enzyme YgiQ (UPF0313 family)